MLSLIYRILYLTVYTGVFIAGSVLLYKFIGHVIEHILRRYMNKTLPSIRKYNMQWPNPEYKAWAKQLKKERIAITKHKTIHSYVPAKALRIKHATVKGVLNTTIVMKVHDNISNDDLLKQYNATAVHTCKLPDTDNIRFVKIKLPSHYDALKLVKSDPTICFAKKII
jgi:hypothetical protein